ncbi:replication fork protection component Swi3-domain-containing protein [Stachybotrys elegans]|uniref:Chromosome segregation in meiosis protein n=1 Tax=Stachybotrys elegans TaxID=80388 RepID=A0A8K0SI46_9HYPO|nr:replication fork protection component Swi3-domain-containing protein [Stachybotrys elegans]
MPANASSAQPAARHDDLDNYNVDDLDDDPFRSPSPANSPKKRKPTDSGLGIDEEVSVQKRARVPNVKLDEDRLLSDAGIPRLRKRARNLKLKGKGHEFSDASRLLTFYQLWLDDLFPKAKFLDALAMVEKAGHKKRLVVARNEWINEGKPKHSTADDDDENDDEYTAARDPPTAQNDASAATDRPRPTTPSNDVPDDDDLYDATPRPPARPAPPSRPDDDDIPDDDELDALMAEYGAPSEPKTQATLPLRQDVPPDDDEADYLEAMIAESERQDRAAVKPSADKTQQKDTSQEVEEELEGLWD